MFSIDNSLWNFLKTANSHFIFKLFIYIALNQPQDGIEGFKISKIQLASDLNVKRSTIFSSIKWLVDNSLIHELKIDDSSDFMVNPRFFMNNSDLQARKEEWNRRCRLDIQRSIRLKQQKHLRELKKQSKQ